MIAICSNFQDLVMHASLRVSMITVPTRLKISTSEKFEMLLFCRGGGTKTFLIGIVSTFVILHNNFTQYKTEHCYYVFILSWQYFQPQKINVTGRQFVIHFLIALYNVLNVITLKVSNSFS